MRKLRVCVVGQGAREHALQMVLSRNATVVVTPGNPGIPGSTSQRPEDLAAGLFVIGPELPLVEGLADRLRAQGKLVLGPGADGAMLGGSKGWMKDLVRGAGVPTADYFVEITSFGAQRAIEELGRRGYCGWVVKTDGLAAGKGVLVTSDPAEALRDADAKHNGSFGEAGRITIIEGELKGFECSLFALCNGTEEYRLLPGARDYKRLSADSNVNTGGMGAYSPTLYEDRLEEWAELTIRPVLRELRRRWIDYRGILYAGLMIVDDVPYVLEFNIRFGDPEAQVILSRLRGNVVKVFMQAAAGEPMDPFMVSPSTAICSVLATEGYPHKPKTGDTIYGLAQAEASYGVDLFYSGVAGNKAEGFTTAGGRVVSVVSKARSSRAALRNLDKATRLISWRSGMRYREDIGHELLMDQKRATH